MKFDLKFDVIEALRETLHTAPFEAFTVRLHTGENFKVRNPDELTVTKSNRIIFDVGKGMRILNPALIASVDISGSRV